jgi:hypothetical protein
VSHRRWSTIHCVIFRNIEAGIAKSTSALLTGSSGTRLVGVALSLQTKPTETPQ